MDSSTNTHSSSSILDLSQRITTNPLIIIDNWTNNCSSNYSDTIDDIPQIETTKLFNIEQSLTDQYQDLPIKEDSLSDSSNIIKSKLDYYSCSIKKSSS